MNAPAEINAAAVKNSPAEKVTPMMRQCVMSMKQAEWLNKATPKGTPTHG